MPNVLKLALVGCGAISQMHLMGIKQAAGRTQITAAIDLDPARPHRLIGMGLGHVGIALAVALMLVMSWVVKNETAQTGLSLASGVGVGERLSSAWID